MTLLIRLKEVDVDPSPTPSPTPGAGAGDVFTIVPGVVVGDAVYISGANTVDKAFAGAVGQTPDAIGVVVELPTASTGRVVSQGLSGDIFSGLAVTATQYLSDTTPGAITATAPQAPGTKVQEIGRGSSAQQLYIDVDATSIIN